jgi:hypothetical protein
LTPSFGIGLKESSLGGGYFRQDRILGLRATLGYRQEHSHQGNAECDQQIP